MNKPAYFTKKIIHYPQLDTVLMVEEFISQHSGKYKKRKLWESLPKKMMYQTYCVIFDYLLGSAKITTNEQGFIEWIWDSEIAKTMAKLRRIT